VSDHRDTEQIGAAIRAAVGTVEAPASLRARIAEDRLQEPPRRPASRRLLIPLAAAAAAVAVAATIAIVLTSGGPPTISEAAQAALRSPTEPPPAKDSRDERYVRARIGGVQFPNYGWFEKDWKTVGARRAELSGRDALTVSYRGEGGHIGYTVVDGDPLDVPERARQLTAKGLRLAAFRDGDAVVLTWRAKGHTCVLASRDLDVDRLVAFATWS
jgi:hypothetical protein